MLTCAITHSQSQFYLREKGTWRKEIVKGEEYWFISKLHRLTLAFDSTIACHIWIAGKDRLSSTTISLPKVSNTLPPSDDPLSYATGEAKIISTAVSPTSSNIGVAKENVTATTTSSSLACFSGTLVTVLVLMYTVEKVVFG